MAEEGGSQEKTEDATPKRLREARKKGQVAHSRDLNTVVILIAAFGLLTFLFSFMASEMRGLVEKAIPYVQQKTFKTEDMLLFAQWTGRSFFKVMLPFLGGLTAVALLVGFLQVGPIFSAEPIKPQAKRLNIIENLKNKFKVTTLVELVKNILKIVFIFLIAYWVLKGRLGDLVLTVTSDLVPSMQLGGDLTTAFLIRVFILFMLLAFLDLGVQRWQYKKQLRMSKEEVKREYKQDEGDPLIKSMRRQLHQELAMGDVRRAVAASDVVITNPTELAVAVKYDDKEMMAPQVMAKGQRLFAQKIREIAEEEGIPIMRNVPLAWSLIELDVGDDIPEDLYAAMAEVLVIVYRMKEEKKTV